MEKDNLEILREDIRGKFDLVLEGHAMLHKDIKDTREQIDERFNVVDLKMNTPNRKIAAVAAQLSLRGAQRRSTFPPVVFARRAAPKQSHKTNAVQERDCRAPCGRSQRQVSRFLPRSLRSLAKTVKWVITRTPSGSSQRHHLQGSHQ